MLNPLANLAAVLIACNNDPNVLRRVFERIAVSNPEVLIEAGSFEGLVTETVRVSDAFQFNVRFIDAKVFEAAEIHAKAGMKVEAIKTIRAGTGSGLKEAKDFVEHYWPQTISTYGRPGY